MPDGSPGLYLADGKSKERLTVGAFPDGSINVILSDRELRHRLRFGVDDHGDADVQVLDGAGRKRFLVKTSEHGETNIALLGSHPGDRIVVGVNQDSLPLIDIYNKGKRRLLVSGAKNGGVYLSAIDAGKATKAVLDEDGLSLFDASGNCRVAADEDGIGFFGRDGKKRFGLAFDQKKDNVQVLSFGKGGKPFLSIELDSLLSTARVLDAERNPILNYPQAGIPRK